MMKLSNNRVGLKVLLSLVLIVTLVVPTILGVAATTTQDKERYIAHYGTENDEYLKDTIKSGDQIISVGYIDGGDDQQGLIMVIDNEGKVRTTLLGGSGDDVFTSITTSPNGNYIVTGYTDSKDWIVEDGIGKETDGIVLKINPRNLKVVSSARIVGDGKDEIMDIQSYNGNYYVAGYTSSYNLSGVVNPNKKFCGMVTVLDETLGIERYVGVEDKSYSKDVKFARLDVNNKGILVVGETDSTNLGYGYSRVANKNGVVVKLDTNLNKKWIRNQAVNYYTISGAKDVLIENNKAVVLGTSWKGYLLTYYDLSTGNELSEHYYNGYKDAYDIEHATDNLFGAKYVISTSGKVLLIKEQGNVVKSTSITGSGFISVIRNATGGYNVASNSKDTTSDQYINKGGWDAVVYNLDENLYGDNFIDSQGGDDPNDPNGGGGETPNVTTSQVTELIIDGSFKSTVLTFSVPTNISFIVNPNEEEYEDMFISPEFTIANMSNAPISIGMQKFVTAPDSAYDFEEYMEQDAMSQDEWEHLSVEDTMKYFSLGIEAVNREEWRELYLNKDELFYKHYMPADGSPYDDSFEDNGGNNIMEMGLISPNTDVSLKLAGMHGTSFNEVFSVKYMITFVFELVQ